MKAETKMLDTRKPRNHRSTEAKPIVVPVWVPQPSQMTRAEIQKLVIDQIG